MGTEWYYIIRLLQTWKVLSGETLSPGRRFSVPGSDVLPVSAIGGMESSNVSPLGSQLMRKVLDWGPLGLESGGDPQRIHTRRSGVKHKNIQLSRHRHGLCKIVRKLNPPRSGFCATRLLDDEPAERESTSRYLRVRGLCRPCHANASCHQGIALRYSTKLSSLYEYADCASCARV